MKEILNSTKRIEYKHYVIYNDITYIRNEVISLKCYRKESDPNKILDLHTIKWHIMDDIEERTLEYFSDDIGWSKNGKLHKSNSMPEIEKVFKETIGKDLIYFGK